jgi:hypothetical protein
VLKANGTTPLHLVSGKGHHLVWTVGQKTAAFDRLARLGEIPASLDALYEQGCYGLGRELRSRLARAFAGAGMLLEYVAHRILIECMSECSVPVPITAVEVVLGPKGREIVSLDISEYGDSTLYPSHSDPIQRVSGATSSELVCEWRTRSSSDATLRNPASRRPNRRWRVMKNLGCYGAEDKAAERTTAVSRHHD